MDDEKRQCPACNQEFPRSQWRNTWNVCPACGHHEPLATLDRIALVADEDTFLQYEDRIEKRNPIGMAGYEEKLEQNALKAHQEEAVVTGTCLIGGRPAVIGVMSFLFMGGSMGTAVGERISHALLDGAQTRTPVILFTASGGARMQEGIFSLMQMSRTSGAAAVLEEAGVPLIIVLTHPTTGGVTASFAMLGDITLAEPGALVGFAGPRVIEGTIGQKLPEGFQTAEFQMQHGFIDSIVPRSRLKDTLSWLLKVHASPEVPND